MDSQIRCAHIMIKHYASRRPYDYVRDIDIERSPQEAQDLIKKIYYQVLDNPQKFPDIAKEVSECTSSKLGGDIGFYGKGQMQPQFEETSFQLKPGELSAPIQTESGFHIIYRIT